MAVWISLAPLKSPKSYEMPYCAFTEAFGHVGVACQLLPEGPCGNSGLAQIARVVTCMFKPKELKVLFREGPRISLGI